MVINFDFDACACSIKRSFFLRVYIYIKICIDALFYIYFNALIQTYINNIYILIYILIKMMEQVNIYNLKNTL